MADTGSIPAAVLPGKAGAGVANYAASLRILRTQRGWSPAELARRAGVSKQTVWQAERGTNIPGLYIALTLAAALGTTVDTMTGAGGAG